MSGSIDEQIDLLNLCGLKCPLPALMARRAMLRAEPGTRIEIITDDPLASIDVPYMCAQEGFDVISVRREGAIARIVLRRPGLGEISAKPEEAAKGA